MAKSFSFDGVDMSAYGLRLRAHNLDDFAQSTEVQQLLDKTYPSSSVRPGLEVILDVVISAADYSTLCSYLDSIKSAINNRLDCHLAIDSKTDRYWLGRRGGPVPSNN